MTTILVSGLINIEVTCRIDGFPIPYTPVRYPFHGVSSSVSGVGYNLAKALTTLGDDVYFLSLIGRDRAALMVRDALRAAPIRDDRVLDALAQTPHSVVLFDESGTRMINTDLKDIQGAAYPLDQFYAALDACEVAMLTNINFSRPMLQRARSAGKRIVSDVHVIRNLEDEYNRDYMAAAHVLFQSHEGLPCAPDEWVRRLWERYGTEVVVIGLGGQGVQLGIRAEGFNERIPAVTTRPIINTIGAGDALCAAFTHYYAAGADPLTAVRRAQVFASYKIGASGGAADGFLAAAELEALATSLG